MNALSSFGSILATIMAIMTTVVSSKVLREHSTLNNPVIPVCVGALSFIGLRYMPEGLAHTILIGYVALAIAILFLLLLMAFQKARRSSFLNDLSKSVERHPRRMSAPRNDRAVRSSNTEPMPRDRRRINDEHPSIQ